MTTNTLEVAYTNGQVIDSSHINELTLSLLGDVVGRNTSGVPTVGKNLGTAAIPWGNVYASGIVLNNVALDLSQVTSLANRIVSGKTRSLSSQPEFITPNGAALSFILKGATTNLILSINNIATTVNTDITKTGITAAPASNNTCMVNDSAMLNDKYAGEDDTIINIDTVGSEITALVGQMAAFSNGSEILIAYVKSTTQLTSVYRGFFFDSSGNPLVRANLSDNSVLTLLKLGWVFVENNGTTVDVTYKTPVTSYVSPTSPVTGDYWFDYSNQVWKRYSGTSWDIINRMLVGVVASNTTATLGSRSFDFYKAFSDLNNIDLEIFSTEVVRAKLVNGKVNVYGTEVKYENTMIGWNITTDLESPQTEAASTTYYLYISDKGQLIISNEKPYDRVNLSGYYHPYHTWRCIGEFFNDGSNNITRVFSYYNPVSEAWLSTPTSMGSTSTAIVRYTVIENYSGTGLLITQSSTLGDSITILKDGEYSIDAQLGIIGNGYLGVSLNASGSDLTTALGSISRLKVIFLNYHATPQEQNAVGKTLRLRKGDVIRGHFSNGDNPTIAGTWLRVRAVNTNPKRR